MKGKNNIFLFIFVILSIIISGCAEQEKVENDPYLNIINQLTKNEMAGRLTGTAGNDKARDFIVEQFTSSAKLEPFFDQSYLHTYQHLYYEPIKQTFELAVHYDNNVTQLEYEKDFLAQKPVPLLSLQLPICPQQEEQIKEDCIFITKKYFPENNPFVKGILLAKVNFSKNLPTNLDGSPIFQISETAYNRIMEDREQIQKIEMNMKLTNTTIDAHNVVGKITGTGHGDHKDALVISAHFDSVGTIGENYIEGAVDNASGIAALLQLAYNLKQHSLSKDFQSDIIFVAFNGEESGLQGSTAFIKDISHQYKNITNINIDVIGIKNINEYLIFNTDNGQVLREQLVNYLSDHQFDILDENPTLTSDHIAFSKQNYPAITIGQKKLDVLHTINDTHDLIDSKKLHEIVTGLFNYIIVTEGHDLARTAPEQLALSEEQIEKLTKLEDEERENLEFGQYKLIELEEIPTTILVDNTELNITSIDNIPKKINWLTIPENLKNYYFSKAHMRFNLPQNYADSLELNKVYELDSFTQEDLLGMNITYLDSNAEGYEISIDTAPSQFNEKSEIYSYEGHEYTVYFIADSYLSIWTTRNWNNKTYYYMINKTALASDGTATLLENTESVEQMLQVIDSFDLEKWAQQMGL